MEHNIKFFIIVCFVFTFVFLLFLPSKVYSVYPPCCTCDSNSDCSSGYRCDTVAFPTECQNSSLTAECSGLATGLCVKEPAWCTLSSNPSTINQGQSSTLSWLSQLANSCSAGWTSKTGTSGSETVWPSSTTTYDMTCTGPGGSGSCSTTVTVITCTPNAYSKCVGDDRYWFDSCDNQDGIRQDCGNDSCGSWYVSGCWDVRYLKERQDCFDRGCASDACFANPYSNQRIGGDCGTWYWTNNYQCSSNWVQREWVSQGCSGGACFGPNYIWDNWTDCGPDNCSDSGSSWYAKESVQDNNDCVSGACVADQTSWDYCDGNINHDRQCSGVDLGTDLTKNCNDFDGMYGSVYRDYYCSDGACVYSSNTKPNIPTLIAPPHDTWINYPPTFQAQVSDPDGGNVQAIFNINGYGSPGGSWVSSPGTSSYGPAAIPDGERWWNAQTSDGSLLSDPSGSRLLKKDTVLPVPVIDQENGISPDTSIWVNLSESDDRSSAPPATIAEGDVDVRINGGSWVNTGLPNNGSTIDNFIYTGTNGNTYEFRYRVKDNAGNWSDYVYDGSVTISVNNAPTANLNPPKDPNCCATIPAYFFSWTYTDPDGHTESRYEFQIDELSGDYSPSSLKVSYDISGLSIPSGNTNDRPVSLVIPTDTPNTVTYGGITYKWRVKVYDSLGADSGWVNGQSFTTPSHHYPKFPDPGFTWLPYRPSPDEQIQFNSSGSTCYDQVQTGAACVNILNGGDDIYYWDFVIPPTLDGDATPADSSATNPETKFRTRGPKPVTLTITDGNGYTCTTPPLTVLVRYPLPKWREIKP